MELQVHALHPIYMSLRALTDNMPADLQVPAMQHDLSMTSPSIISISAVGCQGTSNSLAPRLQERIQSAKDKLAQADVDYEGTMAAKLMIARLLFDREGAALLQVCSRPSNAS